MSYRGVTRRSAGCWWAKIGLDHFQRYLGAFPTPEQAARAYDIAARVHHGPDAVLNFPDESPDPDLRAFVLFRLNRKDAHARQGTAEAARA